MSPEPRESVLRRMDNAREVFCANAEDRRQSIYDDIELLIGYRDAHQIAQAVGYKNRENLYRVLLRHHRLDLWKRIMSAAPGERPKPARDRNGKFTFKS